MESLGSKSLDSSSANLTGQEFLPLLLGDIPQTRSRNIATFTTQ